MKGTETIGIPGDESSPHFGGGSLSSYLIMIYGEYLGRRYPVKDQPLLIGRSPECTVQITDESVSRTHCRIVPTGDGAVIEDLGSTNRTYVNGEPVVTRVLSDQDQIRIGRGIFKFLSGDNIENAYHEEIYRLSTLDCLTGAYNRTHFGKEIKREFNRFLRYRRPLSLLMIDIDLFKKINDEYGHLGGDRALAQLGSLLAGKIRMQDTLCRYGGEEFALLMPEIDFEDAVRIAERLRKLISETRFVFNGLEFLISVSIGVAEAEASNIIESEDLVRIADENLYAAKRDGRNRVVPAPKNP